MKPTSVRGAATLPASPDSHKPPLAAVPGAAFWAKLDGRSWHPLAAHLADVGAVTACLLDGRSVFADRLARALRLAPPLPDAVRQVVVYLACLHDIGKVQHGFQRRRHGMAGIPGSMLGHVRPFLRSLSLQVLKAAVNPMLRRVGGDAPFVTAVCHHGRPYALEGAGEVRDIGQYWRATPERDPIAQIRHLDQWALAWSGLPTDGVPNAWAWTPAALHLLAGVLTLADWIGSSERYFEFFPEADGNLAAYWDRAEKQAIIACTDVGVRPRPLAVPSGLDALAHLFPTTFPAHAPTTLQRHVAEMPLPAPGTRLLVESDTGSGKTEAALTLFARLRAAGRVDGLFFALPTRATAGAMHARVEAVVRQFYAGGPLPAVELAAGGRQGAAPPDPIGATAHQLPDEPEPRALARWTSRSTRHAMAAEVVVGTVDQVLLATLAARHAHLRLAGVVRHLLVVDEVHAYDRYMTAALRALTAVHTALGGVVLFMSATLASETRARLGDDGIDFSIPPLDVAASRPYPSLSQRAAEDPEWQETALRAADERTRVVHWSLAAEPDALTAAVHAGARGARVLVLRNTVRAARETLDRLIELGAGGLIWRPTPAAVAAAYHARYTTPDREVLDLAVRRDFGPGSEARGVILIATQVAEQSLDVDFDLLVTDLCPVDVLLQRLGRVHRHDRTDRAGYNRPSAVVIEPARAFDVLVAEGKRTTTHGHGTVYQDLGDLNLTQRLVRSRPEVTLPAEYRELVEAVYHPDVRSALAAEGPGWAAHLTGRDGADMGDETHAESCVVRFDLRYHDTDNARRFGTLELDGGNVEGRVRTRLGDDRVRLTLPASVPNRIAAGGAQDAFVDLDARVLSHAGIDAATLTESLVEDWSETPDGVAFRIGALRVAYNDRGWIWAQAAS